MKIVIEVKDNKFEITSEEQEVIKNTLEDSLTEKSILDAIRAVLEPKLDYFVGFRNLLKNRVAGTYYTYNDGDVLRASLQDASICYRKNAVFFSQRWEITSLVSGRSYYGESLDSVLNKLGL